MWKGKETVITAHVDFKEHEKLFVCVSSPIISAEVFYYFKKKPQKTSAALSVLLTIRHRLLTYSIHKTDWIPGEANLNNKEKEAGKKLKQKPNKQQQQNLMHDWLMFFVLTVVLGLQSDQNVQDNLMVCEFGGVWNHFSFSKNSSFNLNNLYTTEFAILF